MGGARLALGHAYGGGAQFIPMWLVGADRPERWGEGSTGHDTAWRPNPGPGAGSSTPAGRIV